MSEGTEQDYKETLIDALTELVNLRAKVSAQAAEIEKLRAALDKSKGIIRKLAHPDTEKNFVGMWVEADQEIERLRKVVEAVRFNCEHHEYCDGEPQGVETNCACGFLNAEKALAALGEGE